MNVGEKVWLILSNQPRELVEIMRGPDDDGEYHVKNRDEDWLWVHGSQLARDLTDPIPPVVRDTAIYGGLRASGFGALEANHRALVEALTKAVEKSTNVDDLKTVLLTLITRSEP